jgi:leucyl-tRNA synthetase
MNKYEPSKVEQKWPSFAKASEGKQKYDPQKVERKWQAIWEKQGLYKTDLNKKPKFYNLVMFPYPSADKLHIGHWYNFGPADTFARFKRMQGFNVFEPIGFDAFGLPAENYAIKTGIHPKKSTEENIKYMIKQLKQIGAMYDFTKSVNTSSPSYFKWTQWIFLQLYKNGLAYRKRVPANYCPSCKTVLANEQVLDGLCERCNSQVIQKDLEQWFFKITAYADRLLDGLKKIDWPERTKTMQENWIGKSKGATIKFQIPNSKFQIEVYTTRPDTLFGATYIVLAPEKWQEINSKLPASLKLSGTSKIQNYIEQTKDKTYFERQFNKEKTGVFTGLYAINPVNNEKIPIWISDYVLPDYGTGAIMCVPAHDQRDFEFAKKFGLPIRQVISPNGKQQKIKEAYIEPGKMINSGKWNGMDSEKFKEEIVKWLGKKGLAKKSVCYKLRDWLISRQRYWGAPIPIIYCRKCWEIRNPKSEIRNNYAIIDGKEHTIIPVPEKDLPVLLPEDVDFKPTGVSPLARAKNFINTKCPKCGGPAKRETDTMDTFVCSSWYFLRYLSPTLSDKPWDKNLVKKWLPVDMYIGGSEHATMHLIYARFITKVLYDLGYVHFDEPFSKLRHQGIITYKGAKMSKSKGNVVEPGPFIQKYGSDTFRMYLMFMGPYDEGGDWSDRGIVGIYRFLNKVWELVNSNVKVQMSNENKETQRKLHKTIKKVTEDLENLRFNTAIATLMELTNYLSSLSPNTYNLSPAIKVLLLLLAPFAPHLAEELWSRLGHKDSIFKESWPKYDPKFIKEEKITIIIQVNGKVRDQIEVDFSTSEEKIKKLAQNTEKIKTWLAGKKIKKIIYVPGRLLNIVV